MDVDWRSREICTDPLLYKKRLQDKCPAVVAFDWAKNYCEAEPLALKDDDVFELAFALVPCEFSTRALPAPPALEFVANVSLFCADELVSDEPTLPSCSGVPKLLPETGRLL